MVTDLVFGGACGDDVQGRCNELNVEWDLFRRALEARSQRGLDGVDALVGVAGHLDVSSDLDGLRGEPAADGLQQDLSRLGADVQGLEDLGLVHSPLEAVVRGGVIRVWLLVLPVQGPGSFFKQLLQLLLTRQSDRVGNVSQDGVDVLKGK